MADLLNVDEWFAGLQKPKQPVDIYQRPDIAGQIALLEKRVADLGEPDDESLGGGERADLNAEIDRLAQEFHDSKLTFWVQSLGPEEIEEIGKQTRKDLNKQVDEISTQARRNARDNAKRLGVEAPAELNRMVKEQVQAEVSMFLGFETSLRLLAKAIAEPSVSAEQLRTLAETLGSGQITKLRNAFNQISEGDVAANVPKLSRRGTGERDDSL